MALDGLIPDCRTASGCLIPPLFPGTGRALEIRERLLKLNSLGIGDGILRIYGATIDDLELLAIAQDELNPQQEEPADGNGS